jgi:hypothetical protein
MALSSLNDELNCTTTYAPYKYFGVMVITSLDGGKTLNVVANGKTFSLSYSLSFLVTDYYRNKTGQELNFDGEIHHSGFFGDAAGLCS